MNSKTLVSDTYYNTRHQDTYYNTLLGTNLLENAM